MLTVETVERREVSAAEDRESHVSGETATYLRCDREIAITDSELSAWEVLEADAWLCGGCLTDAEVAAIGDDAMEMAERDRCVRCGRDRSGQGITEEELDNWIVTSDGRNICAGCQIPEDQIADTERTIADLDQLGVIQRGGTPMPRKRSLTTTLYRAARLSNNVRAASRGPAAYARRVVRGKT
jgi:hypothetical protein